jgi:hypothetical protein
VRQFIDDLPIVRIPPLRASGVITPGTCAVSVCLGDIEMNVGVTLQRFPNGGSWSLFLCPRCGRKARALRLLDGEVLCRRCLVERDVRFRCEPTSVKKRAELRIPRLKMMLQSEAPLRLKPHLRYSKLERRSRLQAALDRAEYVVRRSEFKRQVKEEGDVAVHPKVSAWLLSSRSKGG